MLISKLHCDQQVAIAVKSERLRVISIIHDHRIEDGPMLRHRLESAILNPQKGGSDE